MYDNPSQLPYFMPSLSNSRAGITAQIYSNEWESNRRRYIMLVNLTILSEKLKIFFIYQDISTNSDFYNMLFIIITAGAGRMKISRNSGVTISV